MKYLKNGFSLIELIIVITIAGIIYGSMIYNGNYLKNRANYNSFLKYVHTMLKVGCPNYIYTNNIALYNNSNLNISPATMANNAKIKDNIYNGKTPEGNPITYTYKNLKCTAKFSLSTKFLDQTGIKFFMKIISTNGGSSNVIMSSNLNLNLNSKSNLSKGDNSYFAIQPNLNSIFYNGINLNKQSSLNQNQKTYNSLSYTPNAIPDGMGWIRWNQIKE